MFALNWTIVNGTAGGKNNCKKIIFQFSKEYQKANELPHKSNYNSASNIAVSRKIYIKRAYPESSRSVRGLGKDVSGKPYPRLCNARRPRLEPGTFRSQISIIQIKTC